MYISLSSSSTLPVKDPDPRPSYGNVIPIPNYTLPVPTPLDGSIPPPGTYKVPLNVQQNLSRQDITYADRYGGDGRPGSDGVADVMTMHVKGFDAVKGNVPQGMPSLEYTMEIDSAQGVVTLTDTRGNGAIFRHRDDGNWEKIPGSTLNDVTFEDDGHTASIRFTQPNGWSSQVKLLDNPSPGAEKNNFFVLVQNDVRDLFHYGASYNYDVTMVSVGAKNGNLVATRSAVYAPDAQNGDVVAVWRYLPAPIVHI